MWTSEPWVWTSEPWVWTLGTLVWTSGPRVWMSGGGWSHLHLGRSTRLSSEGQSVEVTAVAQGQ